METLCTAGTLVSIEQYLRCGVARLLAIVIFCLRTEVLPRKSWAGLPPDTYNLVIKSPVMAAAGGRRGGGAEYPPPVPGPGGHISKDDRRRFIRLGLILGIRFGDEREEKLKPDL